MYEFLDYRVEDVMTEDPVCVTPDTTLRDVESAFEERQFNGIPVVEDGRLLGWVTKLDLLKAFRFDDDHMFPPYEEIMSQSVSAVMTREPLTVTPRAPLTKVLEKLVDTGNKSFPVVDADERLVAVVAREDVLGALRRAADGKRPGS